MAAIERSHTQTGTGEPGWPVLSQRQHAVTALIAIKFGEITCPKSLARQSREKKRALRRVFSPRDKYQLVGAKVEVIAVVASLTAQPVAAEHAPAATTAPPAEVPA